MLNGRLTDPGIVLALVPTYNVETLEYVWHVAWSCSTTYCVLRGMEGGLFVVPIAGLANDEVAWEPLVAKNRYAHRVYVLDSVCITCTHRCITWFPPFTQGPLCRKNCDTGSAVAEHQEGVLAQ